MENGASGVSGFGVLNEDESKSNRSKFGECNHGKSHLGYFLEGGKVRQTKTIPATGT